MNEAELRQKQMSVDFALMNDLDVVLCPRGEKSIVTDTRINKDQESKVKAVISSEDYGIGFIHKPSVIDIDVDNVDPLLHQALNHFLPPCGHVYGHSAKPRSHFLYGMTTDFDAAAMRVDRQVIKQCKHTANPERAKEETLSVEILYGTGHAVAPGSIHPNGMMYEWEGKVDTSVSLSRTTPNRIMKSIRLAQSAALVANIWQQTSGSHNEMGLALAGLLCRTHISAMVILGIENENEMDFTAPDAPYFVTFKECVKWYEYMLNLAGDEDWPNRLKNFRTTWRKLKENPEARITGGNRLAELCGDDGQHIVAQLRRLFCNSKGLEALEDMFARYVKVYPTGDIVDLELLKVGVSNPFIKQDNLRKATMEKVIEFSPEVKIPMAPLLFKSSQTTVVTGLTFEPSTDDQIVVDKLHPKYKKVNMWRGFPYEPHTGPVSDEDMAPLLYYFREILCAGSEESFEWLLDWVNNLFKHPGNKPRTSIILISPEKGTGKTFFGEVFLQTMFGKTMAGAHFLQINNVDDIDRQFNALFANKLVIFSNEALHSSQSKAAEKLKSMITEDTARVEFKGIDAVTVENYTRFIFTSNHEISGGKIDPGEGERRYTVLHVSAIHRQDAEYFEGLKEWIVDNRHKCLRYFKDREYDMKRISRPVETEAKRRMQRENLPPIVAWFAERIRTGHPLGEYQKFPYQAPVGENFDTIDWHAGVIDQTEWPTFIHLESIIEAFIVDQRKTMNKTYQKSRALQHQLLRIFPGETLDQAGRPRVSEYHQRDDKVIKRQVTMYRLPSLHEIKEYVVNVYPEMADFEEDLPVTVDTTNPAKKDKKVVGLKENKTDKPRRY